MTRSTNMKLSVILLYMHPLHFVWNGYMSLIYHIQQMFNLFRCCVIKMDHNAWVCIIGVWWTLSKLSFIQQRPFWFLFVCILHVYMLVLLCVGIALIGYWWTEFVIYNDNKGIVNYPFYKTLSIRVIYTLMSYIGTSLQLSHCRNFSPAAS